MPQVGPDRGQKKPDKRGGTQYQHAQENAEPVPLHESIIVHAHNVRNLCDPPLSLSLFQCVQNVGHILNDPFPLIGAKQMKL